MKIILFICTLWCCMHPARAQTITQLKYLYTGNPSPLCCSPNSWCISSINCGGGPFSCNFNPSVLDFNVDFSTPNPGGTLGPNPFRFKVELFLNGSTIVASSHFQGSGSWYNPVYYNTPVVSGQYQAKVLFQKFNIVGWVNVGTYWTNTISISLCAPPPPPPPCGSNVIISGVAFSAPLTQSQTWIQSSGTTIVPGANTVKLDAQPGIGYISLNAGFETQSGAIFVAQALDGCGAGIPQRVQTGEVVAEKTRNGVSKGHVSVYPNPTSGHLTVRHGPGTNSLEVWNSMGVLVVSQRVQNNSSTVIKLDMQPPGVYFLRANGKMVQQFVKQ